MLQLAPTASTLGSDREALDIVLGDEARHETGRLGLLDELGQELRRRDVPLLGADGLLHMRVETGGEPPPPRRGSR